MRRTYTALSVQHCTLVRMQNAGTFWDELCRRQCWMNKFLSHKSHAFSASPQPLHVHSTSQKFTELSALHCTKGNTNQYVHTRNGSDSAVPGPSSEMFRMHSHLHSIREITPLQSEYDCMRVVSNDKITQKYMQLQHKAALTVWGQGSTSHSDKR